MMTCRRYNKTKRKVNLISNVSIIMLEFEIDIVGGDLKKCHNFSLMKNTSLRDRIGNIAIISEDVLTVCVI